MKKNQQIFLEIFCENFEKCRQQAAADWWARETGKVNSINKLIAEKMDSTIFFFSGDISLFKESLVYSGTMINFNFDIFDDLVIS